MVVSTVKTAAEQKPAKENKPAPTAAARIVDNLKKATMGNRISSAELEQIAVLANSCKAFLTTAE